MACTLGIQSQRPAQAAIANMEKYSTQLYSMQHLCESIDKEFALAGASSCVLACAIQTLRAGVNLGGQSG